MKKSKNILAILGLCLFLGSMTSCKAIKKMKKKRCKCPTFSYENQQEQADKKAETVEFTFEDAVMTD